MMLHDETRHDPPLSVSVDVFGDIICPWCFIGKRRLEGAIAALGIGAKVEVAWRPFQLNPGMPPAGMDRPAYRSAKFGSLERSRLLDAQVAAVGTAEGIRFAHGRIARTPNTLDAHRLVHFARAPGRQDAVVEALFQAYFVEGLDVGDSSTLVDIAVAAGLDRGETTRLLAGGEGVAAVRDEEEAARRLGVSGVPFFVFDGMTAVAGAQPQDILLGALTQAWQRRRDGHAESPLMPGSRERG